MYKTLRVLVGFAALCLAHATQAQVISNTPYSRFGLGEINENLGNIRNLGMAGVGVSAANSYQANTANPALLYYNSITNFNMGVAGQVKSLSDGNESQWDSNASLYNLSLVVPVSKRWSSAVGLRPYSTVNYEIGASKEVAGNPEATFVRRYEGTGGLSEVYFAHGVRVVGGLSVGGSASYIFGNIANEVSSAIQDPAFPAVGVQEVTVLNNTTYRDFLFRAGVNYRQKLKDKLFISAGGVYTFETELEAERKTSYDRPLITGSTPLLADSAESSVVLPAGYRAGISLDNGSNLTLAADVAMQKWSDYRNFEGQQGELEDTYRVAVGGEYTPNAASIDSYFERITYRAGLYYGETPYVLNGKQITDKGVTVGGTLPIGRASVYDLYLLNLYMGYGQRGTVENGLVEENYFLFGAGFTVNSRWFIKRRIE
ncbi:long-subunit fatty acid transport protein [Pontibacter ummariensis]|uniref:Long-chain fatty acid transport protein n=1 Tax=Pontibacter ummariensis TaxID=1610492 RepID=A0A239CFG4_9BACT|nr:hypothetical protein [Pontibacter ummariensis]PRY15040.1 long-subunit fatty acid transport protein [Pontibacter ummariensis]SNS18965.1 Long-chain fatty acid transport protein [Pontibacter ummariensis]